MARLDLAKDFQLAPLDASITKLRRILNEPADGLQDSLVELQNHECIERLVFVVQTVVLSSLKSETRIIMGVTQYNDGVVLQPLTRVATITNEP